MSGQVGPLDRLAYAIMARERVTSKGQQDVLHGLVLAARVQDGRALSTISAAQLGSRLGLDESTIRKALRSLAKHPDLVCLSQRRGKSPLIEVCAGASAGDHGKLWWTPGADAHTELTPGASACPEVANPGPDRPDTPGISTPGICTTPGRIARTPRAGSPGTYRNSTVQTAGTVQSPSSREDAPPQIHSAAEFAAQSQKPEPARPDPDPEIPPMFGEAPLSSDGDREPDPEGGRGSPETTSDGAGHTSDSSAPKIDPGAAQAALEDPSPQSMAEERAGSLARILVEIGYADGHADRIRDMAHSLAARHVSESQVREAHARSQRGSNPGGYLHSLLQKLHGVDSSAVDAVRASIEATPFGEHFRSMAPALASRGVAPEMIGKAWIASEGFRRPLDVFRQRLTALDDSDELKWVPVDGDFVALVSGRLRQETGLDFEQAEDLAKEWWSTNRDLRLLDGLIAGEAQKNPIQIAIEARAYPWEESRESQDSAEDGDQLPNVRRKIEALSRTATKDLLTAPSNHESMVRHTSKTSRVAI